MKNRHFIIPAILLVLFSACHRITEPVKTNPSLALWYDKPATEWTEALPLGNGRI
ncbi:MAG: glycoside hydrolase family 95 protein, partial [Bacteroidales bacterium]|nr:glycoside hydrolase family 95 protein [Bacteroidales bacterium]